MKTQTLTNRDSKGVEQKTNVLTGYFRISGYLELHYPALIWNNIMSDSIHLSTVGISAHHDPVRRATEALHRAVL